MHHLLADEWHRLAKDLLFWGCGCEAAEHGHKGTEHTSPMDKRAACREAIALCLRARAVARVERHTLVLLLPPGLDVRNQSCSSGFVWLGFFCGFNSSAVGTSSLGTGKHPRRLVTERQQFIYPTSRRSHVSRCCCLKHVLIYPLYRYRRINVSVTGSVLLPHFTGSKAGGTQAPRAQPLRVTRARVSSTAGVYEEGKQYVPVLG